MDQPVSWLCPTPIHRERMLDMEARLRPMRTRAFGVLGVGLLLTSPWIGYATVLMAVGASLATGVAFSLLARRMASGGRPELWIFSTWLVSLGIVAALAAATGGVNGPAMAWFAVPVSTLSARFPLRVVVIGLAVGLTALLGVALATDARATFDNPPLVIEPIVLVIAIAVLSLAGMRSDVHHRASAFVDPLTGCLNRAALNNRLEELTQQSAVSRQPVGLIIGDVDHFKLINDTHGHAAGDAVLVDVAYALRKQLRAYDSVYRIGGEEFLFVLPGSNLVKTADTADFLRRAVEATPMGPGLAVTMSFGASASVAGHVFDYAAVQADADHALYDAKRTGRNKVCQLVRKRPAA